MKTKTFEIFEKVFQHEWNFLRNSETIFENFNYPINVNKEFEKFKDSGLYYIILNESESDKINIIKNYFYESVILPILFEIDKKYKNNEIHLNLENEVLLENTFEIIKKKAFLKEEIEILNKIEEALNEIILEESFKLNFQDKIAKASNFLKEISFAIYDILKLFSLVLTGSFLTFNYFASNLSLLKNLYIRRLKKIDNEAAQIIKILREVNLPSNDFIKEFIKRYSNFDLISLYQDCWKKTGMFRFEKSSRFKIFDKIFKILNDYNSSMSFNILQKEGDLSHLTITLKLLMKRDDQIKRMFSQYRLCVAKNISEFVLGIVSAAFEIDEVSQDLLKRLKELPKQRFSTALFKYDDFYDIKNLSKADKVFLYAYDVLHFYYSNILLIEELLNDNSIKTRIQVIDPLVIEDISKIKNIIKQTINEIEERAQYINSKTTRYEENLRQNKNKVLTGNNPTKPKKEKLFEI